MRPIAILCLLALLVLVATGFVVFRQVSARASEQNPYQDLRAQALRVTPGDLGLQLRPDRQSVYGVVMDMGLPDGTATLAAYSTGDASLYLSSGGGMIGGGGHAKVRQAAQALMQVAESHLTSFSTTSAFDRPAGGRARFFLLTNRGVLAATVAEDEVDAGQAPLSPVWHAAQQVLTELRLSVAASG